MSSETYDVAVVGGGLSGLATALHLVEANKSVILLEARERVGGRTHTLSSAEHPPIDLGGMWVGPTQQRLVKLAERLGVQQEAQWDEGKKILDDGSALRTYSGTIPKMSLFALLELQFCMIDRFDALARTVPLDHPRKCPRAAEFDAQTVASWAAANLYTSDAREALELAVLMIFGCQSADLSLLYFLFYVHAAGGLMQLLEVKNSAQHARFVGGAEQLSWGLVRLLEASGRCTVRLSTPVVRVEWSESDTERALVRLNGGCVVAHACVFAVPPTLLLQHVSFEPALSFEREQMAQRVFMGSYSKFVCEYETAFWRENGFSGEAVCTHATPTHPVIAVFDHCSAAEGVTALVGFVTGDLAVQISRVSAVERQRAVCASLERLFGAQASAECVVRFHEKQWSEDQWSRGCPVNVFQAGSFERGSLVLRKPVGRQMCQRKSVPVLCFAGTETAREWTGYMEGALEAAERCAAEVLHGVSGDENDNAFEWSSRATVTARWSTLVTPSVALVALSVLAWIALTRKLK